MQSTVHRAGGPAWHAALPASAEHPDGPPAGYHPGRPAPTREGWSGRSGGAGPSGVGGGGGPGPSAGGSRGAAGGRRSPCSRRTVPRRWPRGAASGPGGVAGTPAGRGRATGAARRGTEASRRPRLRSWRPRSMCDLCRRDHRRRRPRRHCHHGPQPRSRLGGLPPQARCSVRRGAVLVAMAVDGSLGVLALMYLDGYVPRWVR